MLYNISLGVNRWEISTHPGKEEIVKISFSVRMSVLRGSPSPFNRQQVIKEYKNRVTNHFPAPWITPAYHETVFDLSLLKKAFNELKPLEWLRGKVTVAPEFENVNKSAEMIYNIKQSIKLNPHTDAERYLPPYENWQATLFFTIVPELAQKRFRLSEAPVEIHNSLQQFQKDFPDPARAAFLIMRFRETRAHLEIYEAVGECLHRHGIKTLRADEKYYHDDLYHNILTYMHGCGFGVAVFERIEEELFNPNISLEVGYMLALQKPICIMKDRTLKTLHADLMGKLYKEFDPLDAGGTLDAALSNWLRDKELI